MEKGDTLTVQLGVVDKPTSQGFTIRKGIMQEAIDRRFAKGQPSVDGTLESNFDGKLRLVDVSHQVVRAWIDGDRVMGEIRIIRGTVMGDVLSALVGVKKEISCSSVGYGTVKDNQVCDDYSLMTFNVKDRSPSSDVVVSRSKDDSDDHEGEVFNPYTGKWNFL